MYFRLLSIFNWSLIASGSEDCHIFFHNRILNGHAKRLMHYMKTTNVQTRLPNPTMTLSRKMAYHCIFSFNWSLIANGYESC